LFRHWAAEVHLCQTARTDIEIRMRADAEFPVVLTRQSSLRPGICVQHCNSSRPTELKLAWPDQQRFLNDLQYASFIASNTSGSKGRAQAVWQITGPPMMSPTRTGLLFSCMQIPPLEQSQRFTFMINPAGSPIICSGWLGDAGQREIVRCLRGCSCSLYLMAVLPPGFAGCEIDSNCRPC